MLIIKKSITVKWRKHIHKLVKLLSNRVGLFYFTYTKINCNLRKMTYIIVEAGLPYLGLGLFPLPPLVKGGKGYILHHLAVQVPLHDVLHFLDKSGQDHLHCGFMRILCQHGHLLPWSPVLISIPRQHRAIARWGHIRWVVWR